MIWLLQITVIQGFHSQRENEGGKKEEIVRERGRERERMSIL